MTLLSIALKKKERRKKCFQTTGCISRWFPFALHFSIFSSLFYERWKILLERQRTERSRDKWQLRRSISIRRYVPFFVLVRTIRYTTLLVHLEWICREKIKHCAVSPASSRERSHILSQFHRDLRYRGNCWRNGGAKAIDTGTKQNPNNQDNIR